MYKKLLSVVLVMILAGSLSACGDGQKKEDKETAGSEGEKETITLWANKNEGAYDDLIKEFEDKFPQYKVELTEWSYGDFSDKVMTSLMPDSEGADVYYLWNDWIKEAITSGAVSEIPEELAAEVEEDFLPAAKEGYKKGDTYYGVPIESNCEYGGMVVNKKLFEDNNLKYPVTWEELRAISKQVAVKEGEVMKMRGFDCIDWDALLNNYLAMILQQGGEYIMEDGSVDFATEEGIKAFDEIKSMIMDGENSLESVTDWNSTYHMVYEGTGYMGSVGTWALASAAEVGKTVGVDVEYIPTPLYGDELRYAAESGWGLIVPEKCEKKEAAWEFVKFWTEKENLQKYNEEQSQLPARKSICEDAGFRESCKDYEFVLDILPKGEYIGYYDTTAMRYAVINAMIAVCTTDDYASTKEACEAMSKEVSDTYFGQ